MFENLFSHWKFWLAVTVLVLVFLVAANERGFRDRVNGSVNGKKRWIGFDPVWWEKHFTRVMVAVVSVGVILMTVGCKPNEPSTSGLGLPDWFVNIFMFVGWLLNLVGLG